MSNETPDLPATADPSDPLHLFQQLPTLELSAQELADMKRSVHEMRRAKAIEAESTAAPPPRRAASLGRLAASLRRFDRGSHPLRFAAAFVLLLGTSLLLPTLGSQSMQVARLDPSAGSFHGVAAGNSGGPSRAEREVAEALPLVENVAGDADLIQIEDSEMSLVVVAAIQ